MPLRHLFDASFSVSALLMKTKARRITSLVMSGVLVLLGLLYHILVALIGVDPTGAFETTYDILTLLAYGLFLLWLSYRIDKYALTPLRVFWTGVLVALILSGFWLLFFWLLSEPGFYPLSDGLYPDSIRTAIKIHVLSAIQILYAFISLLLVRSLVLYRRTRASVRNWYVMLALMVLAALSMTMQPPGEWLTVPTQILMIMSVVAMVVNSFRLAWIPYLSFRQKTGIAGLCLLLAAHVVVVFWHDDSGVFILQAAASYARIHSYALNTFTMLGMLFLLTYCMTTMLSLLFHLPTTGELQKKAGELAAIHSVSRLSGKMFDLESLFNTITASPVEAGSAQSAWLALIDLRSGSLRPQLVSTHGITQERVASLIDTEAFVNEVRQEQAPVILDHAATDHRVRTRPGDGIESLLVIPLIARNDTLGALFVAKEVVNGFQTDDLDISRTFAEQAAMALVNARLFEERIEKERMAQELEIAQRVQKRLLPQVVPVVDGAEIAASSVSALEVGGDYYDFLKLDNNRFGIIVGDVSGKGTSAAFYMAEMKGIFQSLGRMSSSPSAFLTNANTALARSMERSFFISAVYAVLDVENQELVLARAGHPPVVLSRSDGTVQLIRTTGIGLGLDRSGLFAEKICEERIRLHTGDSLIFYTDGIVESRGLEGQEYGYERLCESVRGHNGSPAGKLHDYILDDLHHFIGHDSYDDDMTLVVLKWNGKDSHKKLKEGS